MIAANILCLLSYTYINDRFDRARKRTLRSHKFWILFEHFHLNIFRIFCNPLKIFRNLQMGSDPCFENRWVIQLGLKMRKRNIFQRFNLQLSQNWKLGFGFFWLLKPVWKILWSICYKLEWTLPYVFGKVSKLLSFSRIQKFELIFLVHNVPKKKVSSR